MSAKHGVPAFGGRDAGVSCVDSEILAVIHLRPAKAGTPYHFGNVDCDMTGLPTFSPSIAETDRPHLKHPSRNHPLQFHRHTFD